MSTQTNPRPIGDLLQLQTYQGMTDEEIELIIDYQCNLAVNSLEVTERIANTNAEMQARIQQNADNVQAIQDMLQSILSRDNSFGESVQPTTFTPQSIGE